MQNRLIFQRETDGEHGQMILTGPGHEDESQISGCPLIIMFEQSRETE
jgi:hypothetical protein